MNVSKEIFNKFGTPKSSVPVGRYTQYTYNCPFCVDNGKTPDTKGHLSVRSDGLYNCYRCNASGKIHLDSSLSPDINSILSDIKDYLGDKDDKSEEVHDEVEHRYIIPTTPVQDSEVATSYMKSRGFIEELLDYYNCRVGLIGTKFFGRVIIPNKLYSSNSTDMFVARSYLGDHKRYLNPEGSAASSVVFNLHNIHDNPDDIIICEGPITAMSAGTDAVALYGHYYSDKLTKILSKNPKKLIVNLDPDAVSTSINLCEAIKSLRSDIDLRLLVLPGDKDANDYLRSGKISEYRSLVDNAPIYDKFLVKVFNYI